MRLSRPAAVAVLVAAVVALGPGVGGQPPAAEKEFSGEGRVQAGGHKVRMEAGRLYRVQVAADGFRPNVTLHPGGFLDTGESPAAGNEFRAYVIPKESRTYRLTVLPAVADDDDVSGQPLDYSITVTPIPLAKEPLLKAEAKLTAADPVYANPGAARRGPHKAFAANFKAGEVYVITVDAAEKENFDPVLTVEGAGGKIVASDDDGGGYPHCRIVYRPKRGGEHRLVVTSFGQGEGAFTVKVMTTVAGAMVEQPGAGKQ